MKSADWWRRKEFFLEEFQRLRDKGMKDTAEIFYDLAIFAEAQAHISERYERRG